MRVDVIGWILLMAVSEATSLSKQKVSLGRSFAELVQSSLAVALSSAFSDFIRSGISAVTAGKFARVIDR